MASVTFSGTLALVERGLSSTQGDPGMPESVLVNSYSHILRGRSIHRFEKGLTSFEGKRHRATQEFPWGFESSCFSLISPKGKEAQNHK